MTNALELLGLPALPGTKSVEVLPPLPEGVDKTNVCDLAKNYTVEAVETLVHIAKNGTTESARVAAANALLERGHGKTVAGTIEIGEGPDKISVTWV